MNFDDTAKFGSGPSTISEHICPQCVLNGRSHWTANKIFCDHCIVVRESYGFWGEQAAEQRARKKCATTGCRRLVEGRTRFCDKCSRQRKRDRSREAMWRKRSGSDVNKLGISPIGAEALTKAENGFGYHHPQTSISDASFSTGMGIAPDAPQADEEIDTAGEAVAE